MPRLKPSDQEAANRIIRSCITGNMDRQGISKTELARHLNIADCTMRNKLDKPDTFTARELYRASKVLKFTPFQAASIILGRELTVKEIFDGVLKF